MANPGGFLANLVKLVITIVCIRYLEDAYSILTLRAFQMFLIHSLLGMFRFGSTGGLIGKRSFIEFYERFSNITELIPFGILSTEILRRCHVDELLTNSLLLILIILPIVHEIIPRKERPKIKTLIDHSINLQMMIISIVCLQRNSFGVINLVASYIFHRYFIESFCDWFDVPYDHLIQYSLCFIEIFSLTTLKEL